MTQTLGHRLFGAGIPRPNIQVPRLECINNSRIEKCFWFLQIILNNIFWHTSPFMYPCLWKLNRKEDLPLLLPSVHGSSVSLVSTASSLYSSAEEKQAHELRKLRRELLDAQEKVHSLTSQLSTNVSKRYVSITRSDKACLTYINYLLLFRS